MSEIGVTELRLECLSVPMGHSGIPVLNAGAKPLHLLSASPLGELSFVRCNLFFVSGSGQERHGKGQRMF